MSHAADEFERRLLQAHSSPWSGAQGQLPLVAFWCVLLALVLTAACQKRQLDKCTPTSPEPQLTRDADTLCAACEEQNGLCASPPRLVAEAFRMHGVATASTGAEFGIVWDALDVPNGNVAVYFAYTNFAGSDSIQRVKLSEGRDEGVPSIVWTGEHFAMVWSKSADSDLAKAAETAQAIALSTRSGQIMGGKSLELPLGWRAPLTWNGSEFAVGYKSSAADALFLAQADASGQLIGNPMQIASTPESNIGLAWNGSSYGLAWANQEPSSDAGVQEFLNLLEVAPDDAAPGTPIPISGGPSRPNPKTIDVHQLLWAEDSYVLLWSESNEEHDSALYVARVSPGSGEMQNAILLSESFGVHWAPSITQTNRGFAVAWPEWRGEPAERDPQQVFVATVSPELELEGGPVQLSLATDDNSGVGSTQPTIASNADGLLLVAWLTSGEEGIGCTEGWEALVVAEVAQCD